MKIWAYVILAGVLIAAATAGTKAIYDAGFNAATVAQDAEIRKAERDAVAKARQEWENTTEIAAAEIVVEERIVERVRIVEKQIPQIVERIVTVAPECSDLGPDFAGLLNAQVGSGSDRSNSGAASPPEPD